MKTLKTFIIVLIIVICTQISYSQQDSTARKIVFRGDTLLIGNYYTFFVKLKDPLMGKLLSQSEDNFIVFADKDMEEIDTAKIIRILDPSTYLYNEYKDTKEPGYNKTYYYFGAGYTITKKYSSDYYYSSSDNYKNGFNINASSLKTFSKYFGVRMDFDYYHFEREDYSSSSNYSGYYSYSSYTGGAVNSFLVRANLNFGSMNPDEPVQVYFMPALGTGLTFNTKRHYTNIYNNTTYTGSSGGQDLYFSIGVSLGLGFNVKLTNKIRGFAEYQYNAWYLGEHGPPVFSAIKMGIVL